MAFFNSNKQVKAVNEEVKAQAIKNVQFAYGYVSAQSVAIEYNRLMNQQSSEIRHDAKGSHAGTAGRR